MEPASDDRDRAVDSAWSWADSVLLEWSRCMFSGNGLMAFMLAVVISDLDTRKSDGDESSVGMTSGDCAGVGFWNCSRTRTRALVPSSSMLLSSS